MRHKKQLIIAMFVCLQMIFPTHIKAADNDGLLIKVKKTAMGIKEYNLECDLNEDGKADVFDVIRAKQEWVSISERIDKLETDVTALKEFSSAYDINEDGNIDVADADELKQEWLSVSNSIDKLQADITALKELSLDLDINDDGSVDEYDVANIKGVCLSISERIIKLETDMKSLQEYMIDSKNQLSGKFTNKKILNIGDSIAETRDESVSYARQFADTTGAILMTDYAKGGSTLSLSVDQDNRGCIYSQALRAITDNPDVNYDIILIDGGVNDNGLKRDIGAIVGTVGQYKMSDYTATFDESTILGAVENIFQLLRNQYVDSTIVFVIPHKHGSTGANWESILDGIRLACDKWSVGLVDMDRNGELNARIPSMRINYTDEGGTHPNTLGVQKYYLPKLVDLLDGYFVK